VPKDGIQELGARMDELLNNSEDHQRKSTASRSWAKDHDWKEIARQIESVYYVELN